MMYVKTKVGIATRGETRREMPMSSDANDDDANDDDAGDIDAASGCWKVHSDGVGVRSKGSYMTGS